MVLCSAGCGLRWLAALGIALSIVGCSGSEPRRESSNPEREGRAGARSGDAAKPDGVPSDAASSPPSGWGVPAKTTFRAVTFNAGLAPAVLPHVSERLEPVVSAVASEAAHGLDVACVQEFWLEQHFERLRAATATELPHALRLGAKPHAPECGAGEIAPLEQCAKARCASASREQLPRCMLEHCSSTWKSLRPGCLQCLAADPNRSLAEVRSSCVAPAAPAAKREGGSSSRHSAYAYGGSAGLGLLSRHRMTASGSRAFPTPVVARGALFGRLATSELGEVDVYCTHLTADTDELPHPAGRDWSAEHRDEITALLAYINEQSAGRPVLLLGDFNTGPAIGDAIVARAPAQYSRIIAAGFHNPYASQGAQCSYGFDNLLRGGGAERGVLIDHAFVRGFAGHAWAEPLFRQLFAIDVGGTKKQIGISDHSGIRITLSRSRS